MFYRSLQEDAQNSEKPFFTLCLFPVMHRKNIKVKKPTNQPTKQYKTKKTPINSILQQRYEVFRFPAWKTSY